MGTFVKIIIVVLLAVIVQQVFRIIITWGGFAHFYKHYPGPCKQVEGLQPGSEDFHTLPNGLTFISSGLRNMIASEECQEFWRRHNLKGRVYLLNLNDVKAKVQELKIASTADFDIDTFVPHGISVWEDKKKGQHVVFVVNHPAFRGKGPLSRVEKFVYEPSKQELLHQTYYSDPSMKGMNGVVATGENSFYFTNSNYFSNRLGLLSEVVLALPLADVVCYNGDSYTVVDSGLRGVNGIGMSPDAQYIYAAEMLSQVILVYKRNPDNSLTRLQTYPVYTWPDNIEVDESTGDLYVALIPIAYQTLAHFDDISSLRAPSQVVQLRVKNGLITESQELFYDHGELISSASSALVHNGTLLIGSVFHNLVTCQVNVPLL